MIKPPEFHRLSRVSWWLKLVFGVFFVGCWVLALFTTLLEYLFRRNRRHD